MWLWSWTLAFFCLRKLFWRYFLLNLPYFWCCAFPACRPASFLVFSFCRGNDKNFFCLCVPIAYAVKMKCSVFHDLPVGYWKSRWCLYSYGYMLRNAIFLIPWFKMSVADGTFTENCDGESSDMLNPMKVVFF